jgi:hypothetical protein
MSNAEKNLVEILSSGRKPTADDLEAALHSVLKERNALLSLNKDMGGFLAKMVKAKLAGDDVRILAVLDEFMDKHVEVRTEQDERVH